MTGPFYHEFLDWKSQQNYKTIIYNNGDIVVCSDAFLIPCFRKPKIMLPENISESKTKKFSTAVVNEVSKTSSIIKYLLCRFGIDDYGQFFEASSDNERENTPIIIKSNLEDGISLIDYEFIAKGSDLEKVYLSDLVRNSVESVLFTGPRNRAKLLDHFSCALNNGLNEQAYIDAISGLEQFSIKEKASVVLIYRCVDLESLNKALEQKVDDYAKNCDKLSRKLQDKGIKITRSKRFL